MTPTWHANDSSAGTVVVVVFASCMNDSRSKVTVSSCDNSRALLKSLSLSPQSPFHSGMQHNISEAKCPPLHKTSSDITQCHCRDPYQGKYDTNADLHLIVTAACTQMLLSIQKARKLSDKVFQLIHGSCQSEVPSHESMCSPRKFPKDVPTDSVVSTSSTKIS